MRFWRVTAFVVTLGVIATAAFLFMRGAGPLPDPEECVSTVNGHQVVLDPEQGQIAGMVSAIAIQRGLPARAVSIALATGFQESKLHNLNYGDADSVGIFQQRPSQGWGTRAEILKPAYAINAFYDALLKVSGYETMPITVAAQTVQHSGYPEAYAEHAADARTLASALTGYSPGGRFSCVVDDQSRSGRPAAMIATLSRGFGSLALGRAPDHKVYVDVPRGPAGNRLGWAVAQFAVSQARHLHVHEVSFAGKHWQMGHDSEKGWQHTSDASRTRVLISMS